MKNMFMRFLKPRAWVSKLLVVLLLAVFLGLGFLDYLEPIRVFLDADNLSFYVGDMRFSAYLLVKALFSLVLIFWLANIASHFVETHVRSLSTIKSSNRAIITKTLQILIYFAAATIGLNVLGFDLTTLTIFSGAVGIGVGFGLQKISSNFISGIILLFEKSIEDDDLVELADGTVGFIRRTGARYTLLETHDGKEMMIPNEDFITSHVTNWTYSNTKGRIDIHIGVSYDSDIERAMELIIDAAKSHSRCIDDPAPVCVMREFADNSINLLLQFWVADVTQGRYGPQSDVMRIIWRSFKENNIQIPFPQRDVHIKSSEIVK